MRNKRRLPGNRSVQPFFALCGDLFEKIAGRRLTEILSTAEGTVSAVGREGKRARKGRRARSEGKVGTPSLEGRLTAFCQRMKRVA